MNLIALSIIALTMGHVFSNAVRTLPAIAADVLQRDLGITADGLAVLTGAFPATFALAMLPVGVALDRWGVKPTALCLLTIAAGGAVLAANADKVAEYRSGKDKLFGFFVGQTMKAMQGKGNPALVNDVLKRKLS